MVDEFGKSKWSVIAQNIENGRTGKQCRERYYNHLDPNVKKGDWKREEDELIMHIHDTKGTKWALMATFLPGRTDNSIKNRFHSLVRKDRNRKKRREERKDSGGSSSGSGRRRKKKKRGRKPKSTRPPPIVTGEMGGEGGFSYPFAVDTPFSTTSSVYTYGTPTPVPSRRNPLRATKSNVSYIFSDGGDPLSSVGSSRRSSSRGSYPPKTFFNSPHKTPMVKFEESMARLQNPNNMPSNLDAMNQFDDCGDRGHIPSNQTTPPETPPFTPLPPEVQEESRRDELEESLEQFEKLSIDGEGGPPLSREEDYADYQFHLTEAQKVNMKLHDELLDSSCYTPDSPPPPILSMDHLTDNRVEPSSSYMQDIPCSGPFDTVLSNLYGNVSPEVSPPKLVPFPPSPPHSSSSSSTGHSPGNNAIGSSGGGDFFFDKNDMWRRVSITSNTSSESSEFWGISSSDGDEEEDVMEDPAEIVLREYGGVEGEMLSSPPLISPTDPLTTISHSFNFSSPPSPTSKVTFSTNQKRK